MTESELYSDPNDGSSSNQSNGGRRRGGQRRQGPINFEDILQEILVSITDGANSGRAPMFFMGNPGKFSWNSKQVNANNLFFFVPADYAWGREGLDTIVTQLLNQMDNAGLFTVKVPQSQLISFFLFQDHRH